MVSKSNFEQMVSQQMVSNKWCQTLLSTTNFLYSLISWPGVKTNGVRHFYPQQIFCIH